MFRKILKTIEYLAAVLLIVLLLAAIGGVIVVKFYGDDVKHYALEEINAALDTKVTVENIAVSYFQKFPYITIVLDHVAVWSGNDFSKQDFQQINTDTLFYCETLYFQFNPFFLLKGEYKINKIQAVNGFVTICTDLSGRGNYHFLKDSGEKDSPLFIDLKKVGLRSFQCSYISLPDNFDFRGYTENLDFSGHFSDKNYELSAQSKIRIDLIRSESTTFPAKPVVRLKLGMTVADSLYTISDGTIQIDQIALNVGGNFVLHNSGGLSLDLFQSSENIDLEKVASMLPESFFSKYKGLSVKGALALHTTVKGDLAPGSVPAIDARFSLNRGYVKLRKAPYPVEQIVLEGKFSNDREKPGEMVLSMERFGFISAGDEVSGNLTFLSGNQQQFYGHVSGKIAADNLPVWYPDLPVEQCSGQLSLDMSYSGIMQKAGGSPGELYLKGEMGIDHAEVKFPWYDQPFSELNGRVSVEGSDLNADLTGKTGASDFHFSGKAGNLPGYLWSDNETLRLTGKLDGRAFHIDQLIDSYRSNDDDQNDSIVRMPQHIDARIYLDADSIYYKSFNAATVSGSAGYSGTVLTLDHFTMNTMNGIISGKAALGQMNDNSFRLDLSAGFDRIDIQQLFLSFNNFDQDFITDRYLKGEISGKSVFSAPLTSGFTLQSNDLKCESSVVVTNGELVDFEPLNSLSSFINIEELKDIRFSKLENNIIITDSKVIIPRMSVSNSAINLIAEGEHSFDNLYEYHIRLKLSDLLYNKAKKDDEAGFETASDENDQRTIFLKIYDRGDGGKVEYDRRQASEKIRSDLKDEKQELKILFNEEFGMFKNDSAVKQNNTEEVKSQPLFRFEFQEENDQDTLKSANQSSRRDKKRVREEETKPDYKIVIEE